MREPTAEERAKEIAVLYANLADVGVVILLVIMAIASASLTVLSEAVRSGLMLVVSFYALWVMRALHRDRLLRFEYGVGKLEQFVWVVIGLSLVIAGLWVAWSVVTTVLSSEPAATPLALALAAMVNAINLVINFLGWYAMWLAARKEPSGVFGAQLRARLTMLLSSVFLQVTLTIAALAKDDLIALTLDAIGALYVVFLMISRGLPMITGSLPDLLDAPASRELKDLIRATAASVVPEKSIVSIRTRRSGPTTFAGITVCSSAFASLEALHQATGAIVTRLDDARANIDLAIVPVLRDDPPAVADGTSDAPPFDDAEPAR